MKITESKLRSIIKGVIRETYEFPTKSGEELLEKIYMRMVPPGGQYTPLMVRVKRAFEDKCGSCVSCEVLDVTEMGDGASFRVRGDNKECQMTLKMSSFGGPEIAVDRIRSETDAVSDHISSAVNIPGAIGPMESVLRRIIRQVINENVKERQKIPETMINVDPLIDDIIKLSEEEIDYLIIKIAPLIFSREELLGIS